MLAAIRSDTDPTSSGVEAGNVLANELTPVDDGHAETADDCPAASRKRTKPPVSAGWGGSERVLPADMPSPSSSTNADNSGS